MSFNMEEEYAAYNPRALSSESNARHSEFSVFDTIEKTSSPN